MGDRWVHLRMCLICGNVGCCDSSKNKHATKHFNAVGHPLMRSIEPGESWVWCYVDQMEPGELDAYVVRLSGFASRTPDDPADGEQRYRGNHSLRNHAVQAPHTEHAGLDVGEIEREGHSRPRRQPAASRGGAPARESAISK